MKVFVSHSSKDVLLVKTICNQFYKAKIDYWVSFESDIYGEQYAATIIKNIDEATVFLVLISENSNRSIHVINEINSAIMREKPIIPIISGNVELSPSLEYYLSSIHWLQYENNDKFFSQLLKRLYDIEGKDICFNLKQEHLVGNEIKELKTRADNNDKEAMFELGLRYYKGIDCEKDLLLAVKYFCKAAELGSSKAQCNLGWCYEMGDGVKQSWENAYSWYLKSAEKGCSMAEYSVGWMYENGVFVPVNKSEAVSWYMKAAKHGEAIAQYKLGLAYMTGIGVDKNEKNANIWLMRAADQGNVYAQYQLAENSYFGKGCRKDIIKAKMMWLLSAERGYLKSIEALERYYDIFYREENKFFIVE